MNIFSFKRKVHFFNRVYIVEKKLEINMKRDRCPSDFILIWQNILFFFFLTNWGFLSQHTYSKISLEHSHGSKLLVYHMKSLHTYYKVTSDIDGDHLQLMKMLSSFLYSMLLLPYDLQCRFRKDDTWSNNNLQYIPWINKHFLYNC